MLLSIYEAYPSREMVLSEKPGIDLCYIILGTSDDTTARQMLLAATPTAYQNLLRQSASLKPVAPDVWECSVRYGGVKMPEKGDWRWEFDTTGGTQKITQSKENVNNYAPSGKTAPDYHGRHRRDRRLRRGLRDRRAAVQLDRDAPTRRQTK